MPATMRPMPPRRASSRSTLPTPFWRLTIVTPEEACSAISPAMAAVAPLLTVTRMISASAKATAGSVASLMAAGASSRFSPVEVGDAQALACNDLRQRRPQQQRHVAAGQRQAAADIAADAAGAGNDDARMSWFEPRRCRSASDEGPDAPDRCHVPHHGSKLRLVHKLEGRAGPLEGTRLAQLLQRLVGVHQREPDGVCQVFLCQRQVSTCCRAPGPVAARAEKDATARTRCARRHGAAPR